ncbi:OmpH family outer membrane protein [Halomonas saccharevitans]|uniref:Periplasmic chaperone for outer membrane proteins Skp n=1 Tax=Halomonas saccharevitans TaxID=416872 RepID=A0A1I7B6S6_9GAMM|nr:OmpH family outer membrane protein [Halomonas saccharevitans]SFT82845.1 periplasmic chaperone for outer membrane proteins Skp [Halomonas saccharevitans]
MRTLPAALCLGLLVATTASAQADEVAVLDWRAALMETDAAERTMTALSNRLADRQQEAKALGEELQQMQQRLQASGESMTETERRTTLQAFQRKGQRFETLRREIAQARREAEQGFLQEAEPRLDQAVRQVIERHGVAVLVDPNGVLHAEQDLQDLTGEVTERLNALY